jgi:hypothetical protein
VDVDDFTGLVQGNRHHWRHVKRVLLHALYRVFRKLDEKDGPHRQEPASIKKMNKGGATWATHKILLGWTVDTLAMMVDLPPHRVERIFKLLDSVALKQHHISTNKWQKLVGELRYMVLAVAGGRGLFSVLQEVLKHQCDNGRRLRLTSAVHGVLQEFRWLKTDLSRRPTWIAELIPALIPSPLGAQDAAGLGMGGVHFIPISSGQVQHILWKAPFRRLVQEYLVTFSNPGGTVTNNNLELTPIVAHHDVLAQQVDAREVNIHNSSDNMATVWW